MSQVIKKRRIVIASVLKPVDDTRLYEKLGISIAELGWEVHIIGPAGHSQSDGENIKQHALKSFARTSLNRWFQGVKIVKIIHEVKPERIIVNTPELLWVAIVNRIFFGRKVYYDVLENYYRNLLYTPVYPTLFRWPLALLTRLIERLSKPFISSYFLAEKSYRNEMAFMSPSILLENKLPQKIALQFSRSKEHDYKKLLFTGTLAESTGVFKAIELTKELHQLDKGIHLTIAGYTPVKDTWNRIQHEIKDYSFIKVIGGNSLVEHHDILKEIQQADFGIIIYPGNSSTAGSIPTKLYEYLGLKLPILISHTEPSHQLVKTSKAGYILSECKNPQELLEKLKIGANPQPPADIYWESDAAEPLKSLFQ